MPPEGPHFDHLETNVLHAGRPDPPIEGAVVHPIFQSANFIMGDEATYGDVRYIRLNNTPSHRTLHLRLARIENAEAALVAGSGMAAITSSLLAFVGTGEHILAHDSLYGGTHGFLQKDAAKLGIAHTLVDCTVASGWEAALRPETRVFYVEGITNPKMQVPDLEAVVAFARAHKLVSIIDNTIASPANFRPLDLGFDVVVHSATKYLNGHSDLVAGVVAGSRQRVETVKHVLDHLGGTLDPHACFLLERGMKTLALRVERQNANALQLAQFLAQHPSVRQVNYPGLETHPQHARARKLFRGFGGMLSFYARSAAVADSFLKRVRVPLHAASLGGVESLVVRPSRSSHLGLAAEERARMGITDDLVRVSVGIEAVTDLVTDFDRSLRDA